MSERWACRVLRQHRSTQWLKRVTRDDEDALTASIIGLAAEFGRYGYKRITALLKAEGWNVNHLSRNNKRSSELFVWRNRVYRIGRRESLKVTHKQPKRGRLWLIDGSCIRLRPQHRNHVWAYDFVLDRNCDGRKFRMLTFIDEFTRECLAIKIARRLNSEDVLEILADLMVKRGIPDCLSPVKPCHYLLSSGVIEDGTEEAFRRRYFEVAA